MLSFLFALAGKLTGTDEDQSLLARVARQDAAALRKLYDRFGGRAMAIAVRVLGSQGEAEEVVQDAFVEVWRRAAQYDAVRGGVSTWITAIARNRAIDRLRSRGAAQRAANESEKESAATSAPLPTPLEDVEQLQARDKIKVALEALPPEQRLVIELAYFEGLSQSEIAERTGDPLGTVKGRVRSAMEKLGALLSGREPRGGL